MLLNKVKRYLPDASIVVGIISPNGYRLYGYGNISKANVRKENGNTILILLLSLRRLLQRYQLIW